jgi:hypothetical protein
MCVLVALEEQESHDESGGGRDRCRRECAEARARPELAGLQQPCGRVAEAFAEKGTRWISVGCLSNVRSASVASAITRGLHDRRNVALPSDQLDAHDLPDRRQQRGKASSPVLDHVAHVDSTPLNLPAERTIAGPGKEPRMRP